MTQPNAPYGQGQPQSAYPQGQGQQPYGQQQYPATGGFPAGGGYPPQPPKKSNTAVIVTIVAVVVIALGALGITGFVAPGFFLSDDDEKSDGNKDSGGGGQQTDPTSSPQALAERIVAEINNKNVDALFGLKCQQTGPNVDDVIKMVPQIQAVELTGQARETGPTEAMAEVRAVTAKGAANVTGIMTKQGDKWCWSDARLSGHAEGPAMNPGQSPAPPAGMPDGPQGGFDEAPPVGKAAMSEFMNKVNAGDAEGASAMLCAAAEYLKEDVQKVVDNGANIVLEATQDIDSGVRADLGGTMSGKKASGVLSMMSPDDGATWCVSMLFYATIG